MRRCPTLLSSPSPACEFPQTLPNSPSIYHFLAPTFFPEVCRSFLRLGAYWFHDHQAGASIREPEHSASELADVNQVVIFVAKEKIK
jgi:hypothetical protein